MYFEVGDRIKLKKAHPCGSHEWDVLRVGIDFRLQCVGCGHGIMTPRTPSRTNGNSTPTKRACSGPA